MQVFEFHFNPKKQNKTGTGKDDFIFDSFCFEPSNVYEKRMGSLYLAGLLKNVLPQNLKFLDNLAKKIKEKYYKAVSGSQEKSLKDTLKTANEHLEKIAKAGDVSWLGNLSFAVVSLKDYDLNFTKVGDFKTFLLRKNNIVDIDQKIRFDDIEPYPLKIFGNIVSGKLAENDIIVILSKEMADAFLKENLLSKIAAIFPFSQRKLKEALNEKGIKGMTDGIKMYFKVKALINSAEVTPSSLKGETKDLIMSFMKIMGDKEDDRGPEMEDEENQENQKEQSGMTGQVTKPAFKF